MRAITLAATRRDVRTAEQERDSIGAAQRRTLEAAREAAKDRFDAAEVRQYYQSERHLARLGVESDARLHQLNVQAEQQREALVDASKKKKIVERLKVRGDEALLNEYRKLEQEMANEVAINYTVIQRQGEGRK